MRIPPLDASWFLIEGPERPAHVACLAQCTPSADAGPSFVTDLVRSWRSHTTIAHPFNLRPRLLPTPTWERLADADVDLDYHFRHSALPAGGGERELGVLVSRLHTHRLDRRRPLWECHLIEGLGDGRFALYLKLHHSLMDGVAGIRMIGRALSNDPTETGRAPIWALGSGPRSRPPSPLPTRSVSAVVGGALRLPRSTFGRARSTVRGARALAGVSGGQIRRGLLPGTDHAAVPFRAPMTPLNSAVHGPRRFATQHFELDHVREVAKSNGGTVNDVLLAICSGALRRYLSDLGALPRASLTATLPVSIRMDGDPAGGNAITYIQAKLATDEADPEQRFRVIAASTRHAKKMLGSLPRSAMQTYTAMIMAPYMAQLASGLGSRTPPMHNIVISNVPGPKRPRYIDGATVDQLYPLSVLFDGQALNITIISYAGVLCVGFTGCRDSLPSMQRVAVLTGNAFTELQTED